ncbi:hypothetical protein BKA81DRAFT_10173 [Phyllosticta paracitricarpa]
MIGICSPALYSRSSAPTQTHHDLFVALEQSLSWSASCQNAPLSQLCSTRACGSFNSAPLLCRCFARSTSCHAARLRLSSAITEGARPGTPPPKPCNVLPPAPVRFAPAGTRLGFGESTLPDNPAPYPSASSHRTDPLQRGSEFQ